MIIWLRDRNVSVLKIVTCAKLARKKYVLKKLPSTGSEDVRFSPDISVLTTPEDVDFFSPNAACLFLLPIPEKTPEDKYKSLQWMEWELVNLSPALIDTMGSVTVTPAFMALILNLSSNLSSGYIIGDSFSVVDICIWSTLYPFLGNINVQKYLKQQKIPNIQKWFDNIFAIKQVKEAIKEIPLVLEPLDKIEFDGIELKPDNSTPSPEQKSEDIVTSAELKFAEDSWKNGMKSIGKRLPDEKTILPKEGHKNILITSALPYVNNVPHLGNIIGCVLSADVFARYCRICNYNTLFICGTDEYGTATETKALEEGITPRQICDKYFEIHNSVYRWFGIGFDYFGRTTTPEQTEIVQSMFLSLHKNGFVETQTVEQLLCEKCNRFLADRFVEGTCPHPGCGYEDARGDQCDNCGKLINATELIKPRCKLCSAPPVVKNSSHFFLDLPQLEPLLRTWIQSSESGWSNSAQQITKSWLKAGLRPRCITRDLNWGVPVPIEDYKSKVFYVWFDAPIGYISITKKYTDKYEKWWKPEPNHNVSLYQFMAKDNVPFHSVVFPATLLGIGQKHVMVKHIMATEYLNYEDGKFSKSRGVGVFGTDAQETGIPSDVFRFYLLSIRPEGQDSNFSWVDMATRNNSELLNNLGNFVNRAIVFCANSFKGVIPQMSLNAQDYNILALINRELKGYVESMEAARQRDGLKHILNISRIGNQVMQSQQPWVLLKGTDDSKTRAGTIIGLCCNISCLIGILIHPFMPQTSRKLLDQLGSSLDAVGRINPDNPSFYMILDVGHKIGKPNPLFTKIENDKVEELKKKYGGKQTKSPTKEVELQKFTAKELEEKIKEQGEIVRVAKSSGADKSVWSPMVDVLLALKNQLKIAQKGDESSDTSTTSSAATVVSKGKKGSKKK